MWRCRSARLSTSPGAAFPGGTGYRCHVGHALSTRALLGAQADNIERSLWVAVRALTERAAMLNKLAGDERTGRTAEDYRERAEEAMAHSEQARRFLVPLHDPSSATHPREPVAEPNGVRGMSEA